MMGTEGSNPVPSSGESGANRTPSLRDAGQYTNWIGTAGISVA